MVLHGIQDFYSQKAILPGQVRETLLEANVRYLAGKHAGFSVDYRLRSDAVSYDEIHYVCT